MQLAQVRIPISYTALMVPASTDDYQPILVASLFRASRVRINHFSGREERKRPGMIFSIRLAIGCQSTQIKFFFFPLRAPFLPTNSSRRSLFVELIKLNE